MAINLEKGQRINLEKNNGSKLTEFCVHCEWGQVIRKTMFGMLSKKVDVDLDLSCLMFNESGDPVDHIYSPLYRFGDKKVGIPNGKLDSIDRALHHTGDELTGGLEGEVIKVNLDRVADNVHQIIFFLNIYNNNEFKGDFSEIPYARIRMFEGRPDNIKEVFAQYDVATQQNCQGMRALIMGKLYRRGNDWKFAAIGDAFADPTIVHTIARIFKEYNK